MNTRGINQDRLLFLSCLVLGILAEQTFNEDLIGVSYLIFLGVFYSVFFIRFRKFQLTHERMGWFLFVSIWLLTFRYVLYSNFILYFLNTLVIPVLVVVHITLITSPERLAWHQLQFIQYLWDQVKRMLTYLIGGLKKGLQNTGKSERNSTFQVTKKIIAGLLLSIPLLFVVLVLLVMADAQFARIMNSLFSLQWLQFHYQVQLVHLCFILFYTFIFFGFLQGLYQKGPLPAFQKQKLRPSWDTIILLTVLTMLNIIYCLFTVVQFHYFFGGVLQGNLTYAEYARQGFAELILVSLINMTVILLFTTFLSKSDKVLQRTVQGMLTLLVFFSGVMLVSAYMRLSMYEEAYGFTFLRLFAHAFMMYLMFIFAYMLMKIWLLHLSFRHFFMITFLLFYTIFNTINLDQIIVNQNIKRYEVTGKIDIEYLNHLSYTGLLGLIELYKKNPEIPGLKGVLQERQSSLPSHTSLRSYNISQVRAQNALGKLSIK